MIPARGLCLLRPVQTQETMGGGKIVLLENTREKMTFLQAEVVSVGEPALCEDDDCERDHGTGPTKLHPCSLQPNDWVLVEPRQYVELTDREWLAPQEAIIAKIVT